MTQINHAETPATIQPDMDMVHEFFGALFAKVGGGSVHFRAVSEPKDGRPAVNLHFNLDHSFFENVERFVKDCADDRRAAFFLPGTVREGGTGKADVLCLPAIVVDFDKGIPDESLRKVEALLGPATVVVESGGRTDDGRAKLHAHWRLAEPATGADIERVCQLRETLARRFDADTAFKQAGQVVRIGGGIHHKVGAALSRLRTVRESAEYLLGAMCSALGTEQPSASNVVPFSMDFGSDRTGVNMDRVLTQPVHAGAVDDLTRFEAAGKAIGHYLRQVRDGRMSLDEAWLAVKEWNAAEMRPAWDEARLRTDWERLMRADLEAHGQMPVPQAAAAEWARFDVWTGDGAAFKGVPAPRRYLVDGVLPIGVPALLCASGGLGKSYLMLDLARRVATGAPTEGMDFNHEELILGGHVKEFGTAVMFCAEDDRQTVHERLLALDPSGQWRTDRLRPIPLPDAGGPRALFAADREGYKTTAAFEAVRAWLKSLPDLKLVVFDPLQTLVAADITSKPEAGQFVMASLGTLAVELGATVLVTHHMKKTDCPISGPEEARAAMRGTTALVDGVRFAYALWEAPDDAGTAAAGAVVKTNGKSDTSIHRYARLPAGVLRQMPPAFDPSAREEMLTTLAAAIGAAARAGYPYTMTGPNGLFDQQHRLPAPFQSMKRSPLEAAAKQLLVEGRLVKGTARGGKARGILDVPDGDFAMGHGVLMSGAGAVAA